MNLLPSILITATLVNGGLPHSEAFTAAPEAASFVCNSPQINGQLLFGTSAQLDQLLEQLGIDRDSLFDCLLPSLPDCEKPGTPDTDAPSEKPGTPDTDAPSEKPDTPDTDTPTEKPDTPDTDAPSGKPGAPDTDAPIEKPGTSDTDTDSSEHAYLSQVVALVNAERAKYNLPALQMSSELNRAALTRAKESAVSFSHTRPNGSSFSTVLTENGITYRGSGENLAWGQSSPEAVVRAWMNSEGHRANILNSRYTTIGVGYYLNGSTPYWSQLFTY